MVDHTGHKRTTGNFCLYRNLVNRQPKLFLHRNLTTILDAHEALLKGDAKHLSLAIMPANEWRTSGWDFPTHGMLEDLMRGVKPDLKIDGLRLRLPDSKTVPDQTDRPCRQDTLLDLLPDPDDGLLLPCEVHVTVLDTRKDSKGRVIHTEQNEATIVTRGAKNSDQTLDVRLKKPFHVKLGNIFQAEACGTNGQRRWKRTVINSYSLKISIKFAESAHSAQFLSVIESCHVDHFNGKPAIEGIVRATWDKLPNCPPSGRLLPLKRTSGNRSVDLKYGLEVSMGWNKQRESELVRHNRMNNSPSQQLPTPSSSDDLDVRAEAEKRITVRYQRQVGLETRINSVQSLDCVFCTSLTGNSQQAATSIERLLFHYRCFHGHFDWQFGERLHSDDGNEIVCVEVSEKEKGMDVDPRAQENTREGYSWIAPSHPFDLKAYIAGDERWIDGGQGVSEQTRRKGRVARNGATRPEEVTHAISSNPRQSLALEDVQDLPMPRPQHSVVPDIMDVTFYHSSSKQPINPAEVLRHGEADGDDNRLLHSQRRDFADDGLSFEARAFHEAFNKHLDIEQPAGRASIRDACIRFARKHRAAHHSVQWLDELQAKLLHLRDHGLLESDAVKFCLGIMSSDGSAKIEVDDLDERPKRDGTPSGKGQARVDGTIASASQDGAKRRPHRWSGGGADREIIRNGIGSSQPPSATKTRSGPLCDTSRSEMSKTMPAGPDRTDEDTIMADADEHHTASARGSATKLNGGRVAKAQEDKRPVKRRRECVCGQPVTTMRRTIVCDDPYCARGDFHLACLGLEQRASGWKCADCGD